LIAHWDTDSRVGTLDVKKAIPGYVVYIYANDLPLIVDAARHGNEIQWVAEGCVDAAAV
jgi:hypothetical protein